jgi:pimeloyl-ACP methyl ester carboxylesterase
MDADFILTLRTQEEGGQQLSEVREEVRPCGASEWIIFIHGFHDNQEEAMRNWQVLRSNLAIDDSVSRVQCGIFLWPSDESNFYPEMTRQANKAGRKLAAYLLKHRAIKTVLIGHSLGARVALQTAEKLAESPVKLRGLVLLGAAVRTTDCEEFEDFGSAHAKREAVGFSEADKALKRLFGWGERAAYLWRKVEAVGRRGGPKSRKWCRWDSKSADHSYWKFKHSAELAIWALDSSGLIPAPATRSPAETSPYERPLRFPR